MLTIIMDYSLNPRTRRNATTRLSGFTLIELLTVIAIIGILAAILIPVVGRVRDSAKSSVCITNLREWHRAAMLFASDNDDFLPMASQRVPVLIPWPAGLGAYAGYTIPFDSRAWWFDGIPDTIASCPADMHEHGHTGGGGTLRPEHYVSYALNTDAVGSHFSSPSTHTRTPVPMRKFIDHPRTILMADRGGGWHCSRGNFPDSSFRHNGRANMVTMGGAVHSAALANKDEELPDSMWSPDFY